MEWINAFKIVFVLFGSTALINETLRTIATRCDHPVWALLYGAVMAAIWGGLTTLIKVFF
jgi:uncharacterized membrane protein YhfC